jgi:pyrroloquinoline quinone (PQQ) biosynthesis protein C
MHTQTGTSPPMDWTPALEHEARTLVEALDAHPIAQRLFQGTLDADRYARYLAQTYHYVRWTTPLLASAGERIQRQGSHPALGQLLLQKAREERGHERWLLSDLKNLGWTLEQLERTEPCPAVAAYVAWNRFTTQCGVPTAFFGTAYVLEFIAVQRACAAVERMLEAQRIPNIAKAVTFLRGHGQEDAAHVAELTQALRALTDRAEQEALLQSARVTRALYTGIFS